MSLGDSLNLAAMHAVVAPALSRPARYRHCSSCAPPLLFFLLAQWVPNKVSATSVHVHVVADTATFGDGTGPLQWARGGAAGHAGTVAKYPIPQPPKGEHYLNKIYERVKPPYQFHSASTYIFTSGSVLSSTSTVYMCHYSLACLTPAPLFTHHNEQQNSFSELATTN